MTLFQNGYALLIGVGDDLPVTVQDAEDLADVLRDPGRAAYKNENVIVRTGPDASRAGVLAAFDELAGLTKDDPDATIFFFYSGHGACVTSLAEPAVEKYYLLTHGYDLAHPDTTCLSDIEFTAAIESLRAKKMLVLLDCCHAAGIPKAKAPGVPQAKSALPPSTLAALKEGTGTLIVASCRKNQVSYTGDPNSLFTAAILEALAKGGASGEDASVFQVLDHVTKAVPQWRASQEPLVVKAENLSNFTICRGAWTAKSPAAPGKEAPTAPQPPAPALAPQKAKLPAWKAKQLRTRIKDLLVHVETLNERLKSLREALEMTVDPGAKFAIDKQIAAVLKDIEKNEATVAEWSAELGEED